jgi:molecular chaperone DnaK (HSP70)
VGYGLGIDIGTVVVAAAITVDDGVEMFPLGDRSILQPAVVYLREDGTLVAGDAARREAVRTERPRNSNGALATRPR